jgi:hypothetical protein
MDQVWDPGQENEIYKTPFDGNLSLLFVSIHSGKTFLILRGNVADSHHFDADPDPDLTFHSDADPDPSFNFDPDPTTLFSQDLDPPMLQNDPQRLPPFHFFI